VFAIPSKRGPFRVIAHSRLYRRGSQTGDVNCCTYYLRPVLSLSSRNMDCVFMRRWSNPQQRSSRSVRPITVRPSRVNIIRIYARFAELLPCRVMHSLVGLSGGHLGTILSSWFGERQGPIFNTFGGLAGDEPIVPCHRSCVCDLYLTLIRRRSQRMCDDSSNMIRSVLWILAKL